VVPLLPACEQVTTLLTVNAAGASSESVHRTIELFCGAAPGSAVQPCCPPDPFTQGMLDQILSLVTLIQRQAVPFAYVASTAHAGISGAGSFSIPALLGVKVGWTTTPSELGVEGTSPETVFDAGWITFGTTDGYPTSVRLEHSPQIIMPARCSAYTELAYDLHPGVVVTITELVREP